MNDQLFMRVYQTVSALFSLISVGLYIFGTVKVFSARQPSADKQWIGFGLATYALIGVFGLTMQFAQRIFQSIGNPIMLTYFAMSHLAGVIATSMIIFGVLRLLRRNALLEEIQNGADDDR